MEEAFPEAAAILAQAGWTPHPEWGVYTRGTLVMGGYDGAFHVKDYARIPPGHPQHGPDTPDEPHEAAAWLVARFSPNPLETEATLEPPVVMNLSPVLAGDDVVSQVSAVTEGGDNGAIVPDHDDEGGDGSEGLEAAEPAADLGLQDGLVEFGEREAELRGDTDPIDAEFDVADLGELDEEAALRELEAPFPEDFAPDEIVRTEEEAPQDRFIGLDDLDRRRSLRIGDVIRHGNGLLPRWTLDDDARLATLRNFAAGVATGTFSNSDALQSELDALETTIRRINEIKNARDAKVEFLEGASREEVEAFVVEANWP